MDDVRQTLPDTRPSTGRARFGAPQLSFQTALFLLLGGAVIGGVVPAGLLLNQRVAAELERRTRDDLARAPKVLADRSAARADAMMMHAKDLAASRALIDALVRSDYAAAEATARASAATFGEAAVLIDRDERRRLGPSATPSLLAATRRGEMPTAITAEAD